METRREMLVGSGAALSMIIAGCSEDTSEVEGGTRDGGDDDGGSSGSADLEIIESDLEVEPGQFSTDVYVTATVENTGEVPSGDIELQADWYDGDGNYLDNDTGRLTSLNDGETWSARVYNLGSDAEDIEDYELEGEFSEDAYEPADGLSLLDSSMDVSDGITGDEITVEGEVENESGEDQDYVEVVAKIYDEDGNVLGDEWTNVTDLRDGETWSFNFDHFSSDIRNRVSEAADHEILVKSSRW